MLLIQLTGLSGAGKTTLAFRVQQLLLQREIAVEIIDDGDYRHVLYQQPGSSPEVHRTHMRDLGARAYELVRRNTITIIAAINPYDDIRRELKAQYNAFTVWVHCSLDILVVRDTKGLYRKALLPDGDPEKIANLTGINDPYDVPVNPDLIIQTHTEDVETSAQRLLQFVLEIILETGPL